MRLSSIYLTAFLTLIASLTMGNFLFIQNFPALAQTPDTQLRERESLGIGIEEILIVGNPSMPSLSPRRGELPQQLANLPGAEQEALAIAQLFNSS